MATDWLDNVVAPHRVLCKAVDNTHAMVAQRSASTPLGVAADVLCCQGQDLRCRLSAPTHLQHPSELRVVTAQQQPLEIDWGSPPA